MRVLLLAIVTAGVMLGIMIAASYDGYNRNELHRAERDYVANLCREIRLAQLAREYAYSQYKLDWDSFERPQSGANR